MDKEVIVSFKHRFNNFLKFYFLYTFSRPLMLYVLLICIIFLCSFFNSKTNINLLSFYAPLFLIGTPIIIYYTVKRRFNVNNFFSETVTYAISKHGLHAKGQTFESDYAWEKLYKVKEFNKWFLFFQDDIVVLIIPTWAFASKEDIQIVSSFIKELNPKVSKLEETKKKLIRLNIVILTVFFFCYIYKYGKENIILVIQTFAGIIMMAALFSAFIAFPFALIPSKVLSYQQRALKIFLWSFTIISILVLSLMLAA